MYRITSLFIFLFNGKCNVTYGLIDKGVLKVIRSFIHVFLRPDHFGDKDLFEN